ncbi:glucocorticoid modulatory element-binding protein 1-like [Corythoichthys intestinalis]|uniref:glucocorticoid modulatory element-binding protein 1-like n=1 Tax=Corythoichthys intestinalis TaxID=161448 RepID=UPI0025A4E262|nr:glucocorticoid modulatory element-binding protein 1-like [Corythoichthys intestinalis]XP_057689559.1 glucocorticoid modulatory element-binding protein 1-like [Corythoichthys intestinalis]XP_057689560.1 glucocorticoid modulatory element-binding protein 1-like [Corythoichthys intestinalis]XP_057689561.1 glucocorticoid modulatory element-binding protein 1-like [Corythoichthys intestinalis]XP_061789185.1 glucocorticoid modulatory element-binding protein 1-like [Nerophis lumbriciformis]
MMEKEEEGASNGNNHKAQVILHLQPILHGGNYDIADTSSTVLAIETQHDDNKSEGESVEYGYPITCGESRAVLLFKKFVCPGINVRCVKFNDQLISPKQFVHLAGKATLKDWKRAIRLGGVMLRKMMDSGQIDFYQHDTVCSNTCRSTKFDMLINSSQLPLGTSAQSNASSLALESLGGQVPPLTGESLHDAADLDESLDDKFGGEWGSTHFTTANGHAKRKRSVTPDGILSLWKGVAECGLMGEVLSGLQAHILATLKGVEVRSEKAELQETDAIILNSLCEMFGLLDSVKQALEQRRGLKEDNDDDGVYDLEELSKERRKQASVKSTSYKHLRPQRHQPPNSQLSPTLSNTVIQPVSLMGLPESTYTHPNISPQNVSYFPTPGAPRAGAGKREERMRAHCESGKHARAHRAGQELTVEMQHGLGQSACKLQPQLGSEELGEGESLHSFEKVALGRKGCKKLKTK